MKKTIGKEYINFLNEIKSRIVTARIQQEPAWLSPALHSARGD
ncbi:MAG: hypothetical protein WC315_06670 [Candidatus Omnitrophota bacterium]|jgi:hypothetical protein